MIILKYILEKQVGRVDCIQLAQDTVYWKAFLNT